VQQLRKALELADIGFQVSGIDERSPVKPHQVDLIEIGRNDLERRIERFFGRAAADRMRRRGLTRRREALP
jgi:hypothetical protein